MPGQEEAVSNSRLEDAAHLGFQTTLKDLEAKMREAASNLEFETAARLRDEIKRLKMLDLEFANDILTAPGEAVDKTAVPRMKAEAKAAAAERFRKARLGRR